MRERNHPTDGQRAVRVSAQSFVALISLLLVVCLLLCLPSCARPPKADDLRADVVALVEASYEINEVFLGAGLPVLDRNEPAYADLYAYYASSTVNTYDIVDTSHAKFTSIDAIKAAASRVYSPELLETNLYQAAFTGYVVETAAVEARFVEDGTYLYQAREPAAGIAPEVAALLSRRDLLAGRMRVYDFSTLRVVRPSTPRAVFVTMNSWYVDRPETVEVKRLRLVLTPSGWRLDSFTV